MEHHRKTAPRQGPRPPAWWTDDEEAYDSTQLAMFQMRGVSDQPD